MSRYPFRYSPIAAAILASGLTGMVHAQNGDGNETTFSASTLEVQTSADASEEGLSPAFAGGQVAEGGRVGLLGNQDVMETAYSFTNYTELLIEDQQASSVGDVLLNDPAVRVARGFGNFQQVYLVRGLPVFSDDMTYNGLYGLLPRQYLASEFIQRVQVFRGANTFLKGAAPGGSGLGGAINVVPKRAPNYPLTQVTTGIQSGGQAHVAADIARRSEDGRYGVRVNAARRDGDTAVDGESRELSMSHIGLDYRGDDLRLSADLGYQDHLMDASQPNITISSGLAVPDAPDASESVGQPWTYSESEDVFGTLRGEYDLSEAVTGWLAFGMREGEEDNTFANLTVNDANGDFTATRATNAREDSVRTGQVGIRGEFETGPVTHTMTVSGSLYSSESKNAYAWSDSGVVTGNIYDPSAVTMPLADGPIAAGDLDAPLTTAEKDFSSIAIADQISMLDEKLLFTLGARYQRIETHGFNGDTGAQNSHYDDNAITPTFGAVYRMTPELSAYVNYIEGLQEGETVPESTFDGTPYANAGKVLAPYTTKQSEMGVKLERKTFGGSASIYRSSKPIAGTDGDTYQILYDQRNTGLEVNGYGKATQNLTVLGGVSFLDADADGNDAIGSPNAQANLNLKYDVPALPDLALDSRVIYTSSQYADSANQQKVPSWTRLDIGARYLVPMGGDRLLTLRARVENVADSDYWASAGGYPGQGYLTLGSPRTVMASATVDF